MFCTHMKPITTLKFQKLKIKCALGLKKERSIEVMKY